MRATLRLSGALVLCALAAAPAAAQERLPDTPAGRQLAALLQAVRDGRPETVRSFVQGSMNDEFQRIPMEEHVDMFGRIRLDLGSGTIQEIDARGPERIEVTFTGSQGPLQVRLTVEPAPPHRIAGLDLSAGGRRAEPAEPVPSGPLAEEAVRGVVERAAILLAESYVDADTGRMIGEHLRARHAAGAYRGLAAEAIAEALTVDLRAVNGDRHLRARVGEPEVGRRRVRDDDAAAAGVYRFLDSVAVLAGNVGYLRLNGIPGAPEAFEEVARALRALERTQAMVLDLRGSPGGSAQMANFLVSHFTAPGLLSLAVASRARGDTMMRRTLAEVPGPRRLEVPLYVLIDRAAGSAAEDIPFVLKNLGRATLIGERTAGAGRNNRFFPLGSGLSLSVSITRVWDPCTGREWERVGVEPDVVVPAEQALDTALAAIRRGAPPRAAPIPQAECRARA